MLAAVSGPFKDAVATQEVVRMDKTSAATLEEVLRFCYTGTATLTAGTVLHICTVADQFQIHALHQQCKQYIEANITVGNCVLMLEQADHYKMQKLGEICWDTVERHFDEAAHHEGFLHFRFATLRKLLCSDSLWGGCEYDVFCAVLKWVGAESARDSHLAELLGLIRFPTMTLDQLTAVGKEPRVVACPGFKDKLLKAFVCGSVRVLQALLVLLHGRLAADKLLEAFMWVSQSSEDGEMIPRSSQHIETRFRPRPDPDFVSWAELDLCGEICHWSPQSLPVDDSPDSSFLKDESRSPTLRRSLKIAD
eukprot:jgi/Astpho2/6090/Aster-04037